MNRGYELLREFILKSIVISQEKPIQDWLSLEDNCHLKKKYAWDDYDSIILAKKIELTLGIDLPYEVFSKSPLTPRHITDEISDRINHSVNRTINTLSNSIRLLKDAT